MKYKVLITDVTNYGQTLFCVAGWDLNLNKMVRPEPPGSNTASENSRFWHSDMAGPGKVLAPGNVISFEAESPPASFPYPHATEDRVVNGAMTVEGHRTHAEMIQAVAPGSSKSVSSAFIGLTRQQNGKAYVAGGTKGPSLGAVDLGSGQVKFYVSEYENKKKLRAIVQQSFSAFDFGVTSDELRSMWRTSGVGALNDLAKQAKSVHVRLGLARPFPADQCFAQMNGAYFY